MPKLSTLLLVTLLLVTGCVTSEIGSSSKSTVPNTHQSQSAHSMANQMLLIKDDKSFIEQMIPHHEEAVQSAQQVLARSTNEPLKSIASSIVSAQTNEIEQMKSWYKNWFGAEYQNDNTYIPMMTALDTIAEDKVGDTFIQDMVMHHNSAILSANTLLGFTKRPELIQLANNIIRTQAEENTKLQALLNHN